MINFATERGCIPPENPIKQVKQHKHKSIWIKTSIF